MCGCVKTIFWNAQAPVATIRIVGRLALSCFKAWYSNDMSDVRSMNDEEKFNGHVNLVTKEQVTVSRPILQIR